MSELREPPRLLEAHDAALVELEPGLRQARSAGPSTDQQMRMRVALGLPAAPGNQARPAPEPALQTARERSARWSTLVKVLLGAGLGLLAAIGAFVEHESSREPSIAAPRAVRTESGHVSRAEPSEPVRTIERGVEAQRPAKRALATQPRRHRADASVEREPAATAAPAAAATLVEELALLRRAKAYAVSEPDRALALLDEHERRFARGALVQEREVVAIEALLARGDRVRAQQRATRFLERHPGSAHARRVRTLLGYGKP